MVILAITPVVLLQGRPSWEVAQPDATLSGLWVLQALVQADVECCTHFLRDLE